VWINLVEPWATDLDIAFDMSEPECGSCVECNDCRLEERVLGVAANGESIAVRIGETGELGGMAFRKAALRQASCLDQPSEYLFGGYQLR
jgi:hypothetical protein